MPGSLTGANYLTAASAIAAKSKLGERADRLSVIIMHSSSYFYLTQVGMLTFSSDSLSSGTDIKWGGGGVGITNDQIAYFAGMRVIVDDNIKGVNGASATATHALKYPVYLLAQGAIAEGVQQELRIEADRNILSKQDVISVDYHYGYHAFGSNYSGADNPTNAVLANCWFLGQHLHRHPQLRHRAADGEQPLRWRHSLSDRYLGSLRAPDGAFFNV